MDKASIAARLLQQTRKPLGLPLGLANFLGAGGAGGAADPTFQAQTAVHFALLKLPVLEEEWQKRTVCCWVLYRAPYIYSAYGSEPGHRHGRCRQAYSAVALPPGTRLATLGPAGACPPSQDGAQSRMLTQDAQTGLPPLGSSKPGSRGSTARHIACTGRRSSAG